MIGLSYQGEGHLSDRLVQRAEDLAASSIYGFEHNWSEEELAEAQAESRQLLCNLRHLQRHVVDRSFQQLMK